MSRTMLRLHVVSALSLAGCGEEKQDTGAPSAADTDTDTDTDTSWHGHGISARGRQR